MISGRLSTGLNPDGRMSEFHETRQSSNPGEAAGGAGTAGGRWQSDTERICYGAAEEAIMASWKALSVVWEEFGGFSSRQATTRLMYSWANKKVGH
ncbi:unnamed protein product [Sphagnum balticum]